MRAKAKNFWMGISAFLALFLSIIFGCAETSSVVAQERPNGDANYSESPDNSILRTWQIGGFASGGFPPYYMVHAPLLHYQEELQFYSAGFEIGRMITASLGPKVLRGRGELVAEIDPYWQINHPAQMVEVYPSG